MTRIHKSDGWIKNWSIKSKKHSNEWDAWTCRPFACNVLWSEQSKYACQKRAMSVGKPKINSYKAIYSGGHTVFFDMKCSLESIGKCFASRSKSNIHFFWFSWQHLLFRMQRLPRMIGTFQKMCFHFVHIYLTLIQNSIPGDICSDHCHLTLNNI